MSELRVLIHCGTCIDTDEPCPCCPVCGEYVDPQIRHIDTPA